MRGHIFIYEFFSLTFLISMIIKTVTNFSNVIGYYKPTFSLYWTPQSPIAISNCMLRGKLFDKQIIATFPPCKILCCLCLHKPVDNSGDTAYGRQIGLFTFH